jgi:NAD-dependent dihydropyrimidine dehydrogenase PreA subunit
VALGDCPQPAGVLAPVIDQHRCEGAGDCVTVCPYQVFEMRQLTAAERGAFPFMVRLKLRVHGNKQAFATGATKCHACGLCVVACPEKAITLGRPRAA